MSPTRRMLGLQAMEPNTLRTLVWARGGAVESFGRFVKDGKKKKFVAHPMSDGERLLACEYILGTEFP